MRLCGGSFFGGGGAGVGGAEVRIGGMAFLGTTY